MIGLQNIDQFIDIYGQHRARSILSGFSTSITFRLNDGASREYVKDMFGGNRKREIFLSTVQSRGVVEDVYNAHVVEDWDITRLGMDEAIIGLPGQEPIIFRFDEYKGS
jgi:type IV secretory pathway TraG/TraD family ATPase VirD4